MKERAEMEMHVCVVYIDGPPIIVHLPVHIYRRAEPPDRILVPSGLRFF